VRHTIHATVISILFAASAAFAADEWPARSITLVGPFAAGGSTDITARIVAEELTRDLGKTVVVDARPGASGSLGVGSVARAAPDGYTILLGTSGTHAAIPHLLKDLTYDPVKDFAPIGQVAVIEAVLAVHPNVPAKTVPELITYAKANPGKLNYGTAGPASAQHVGAALFESMTGTKMTHIPFRGSAPAIASLVGGNIDLIFGPTVELLPQIQGGTVRAIAVTTTSRSPQLPNLPTVAETLPGYELVSWSGLFAPAGTSPDIVKKISASLMRMMKDPKVSVRLGEQGLRPIGSSTEDFTKMIPIELLKWKKLIEISGAKM
jgi:tripartite-type tricarboxylate transporter receptor subunit TctC